MHVFPLTFPITFITSDFPGAGLLLSIIAKPACKNLPNALALSVPPTSGATQIKFLFLTFLFYMSCKNWSSKKLSTGISKNP